MRENIVENYIETVIINNRYTYPYVYFILSLEECVLFTISIEVFRKNKWMRTLV